ncbi:uncharacterized protein [Primulina huaijiensis]|uniref:uncharacterized protein n=1 Tax=Primulina huaijiensis TaxID=1492673 RepID=UPI003CC77225
MMLRSKGKPPLAKSPIRLRPRRGAALQPSLTDNIIRTPPGSLKKSKLPNRSWDAEQSELRPEYHTISCELSTLAKMVQQELKTIDNSSTECSAFGPKTSPLFERGRFYEVYSARRNERLKRKKCEMEEYTCDKKPSYDLGVRVESEKTRASANKFDSRRKALAMAAHTTPLVERREAPTPRYSLRSSTRKENKKPPLPIASFEKSVGITTRKVGARKL